MIRSTVLSLIAVALTTAPIACGRDQGPENAASAIETYPTLFALCGDPNATPAQVQEFLNLAVDVNTTHTAKKRTPLHQASQFSQASEVLALLIEAGADVNARDVEGESPLHLAARSGTHPQNLSVLIEAGADLDSRNALARTPLHGAAAREISVDQLAFLPRPSSSPVSEGQIAVLIRAGSDANAEDQNGMRPLHIAALGGSPSEVLFLVQSGADPTAIDQEGNTPLHLLQDSYYSIRIMYTLIASGADPNALNAKGETPYDTIASRIFGNTDPEIASLLADLDATLQALLELDGKSGSQSSTE